MGSSTAVCITMSKSLNGGGGLSGGRRGGMGRDGASMKLCGYQQYLYY